MFNTHEYIKPFGNLKVIITNEFDVVTKEFSVNKAAADTMTIIWTITAS